MSDLRTHLRVLAERWEDKSFDPMTTQVFKRCAEELRNVLSRLDDGERRLERERERFDFVMRHISGAEARRIGIEWSGPDDKRCAVDRAIRKAAGET